MLLTLCHSWDSNLQYSDPKSMGRVATPGGDLLYDLLYHLLTPCVGTIRTIAFTIIYKNGEQLSQLVILYFAGSCKPMLFSKR